MLKIILKYSLTLSLIWTVIIFLLCCTPGQYIPTTNWLELLSFDKFVHASIFFTLVVLWLIYLYSSNKLIASTKAIVILLCIGYGGILEIMQATIFSHRSGDWLDFIANSVGCLLGWWLFTKNKDRLKSVS